jgi:hypothetical protein
MMDNATTSIKNSTSPSYSALHEQHQDRDSEILHSSGHDDGETMSLLRHTNGSERTDWTRIFQRISPGWMPSDFEDETSIGVAGSSTRSRGSQGINNNRVSDRQRSVRRKFFLFLTEPDTSVGSAILFFVIIFAIFLSNVIMIMQSMETFQYTPTDCRMCGGETVYLFDDDASVVESLGLHHKCVCPPQPFPYLQRVVDYLLCFFAFEWTLRVISYSPANPKGSALGQLGLWVGYLTSTSTLIDALAIWPYFFETLPRGLVSLRLFRLLRVFQLVRLGQYNKMFTSLTNVLLKSVEYLKLMALMLIFGAAFFGSIMYWLEQGRWKYWEPTGDYQYVRIAVDGVTEEISPYNSIPAAFWWFIVTATTVGYGGKYISNVHLVEGNGKKICMYAMINFIIILVCLHSPSPSYFVPRLSISDYYPTSTGGQW